MTLVTDLFRRRVPQVVAIYIGASWGLVEIVDFITQRFALSPYLVDLALVGPLLLLPSVILVTYFHGAPGQDEWVRAEKIGIPANLVVAVLFLVFSFQGKDLGAVTTTVVVTDEEGVESERVIPKTDFRKRLTVYFFDAEPTDTAAAWIQYGLPAALLSDLSKQPPPEVVALGLAQRAIRPPSLRTDHTHPVAAPLRVPAFPGVARTAGSPLRPLLPC